MLHRLLFALGATALCGACHSEAPRPQDTPAATSSETSSGAAGGASVAEAPRPLAVSAPGPKVSNETFGFLLQRYDENGDAVLTSEEYARHPGQFARWDTNGDGRVTEDDWDESAPQVSPQIDTMQRMDVLGRYFQTDENETEVLTIDELVNAALEYDAAGNGDEVLSEAEFRARAEERAVTMPGDGSMMMQSYVGQADGWGRLVGFYDLDRNNALDLTELTAYFEERDLYELRFDQVRFDDGAAGARFDEVAYREGLPVGSPVPDLTLATLHGDEPLALKTVVGSKPVALIFGSYT